MSLLFENPILAKIEDVLLEKAIEEIEDKVKKGEIQLNPKEIKREAEKLSQAWLSQQRSNLKMALKEYSKIAYDKTQEALEKGLSLTNPSWYSVEIIGTLKEPLVLVVPLEILKNFVEIVLDAILSLRIEFSGVMPESRMQFAKDAVQRYFYPILDETKSKKFAYNMNIPNGQKAGIVELKKNDLYYLADDEAASRIDTIIFSTNDSKWWQENNKNVDFRPQGRCFTNANLDCWGLAKFDIHSLRKI